MKKLFTSIVFISSVSAFAFAPSIAGKWRIHQSIAGNESAQGCTIAVSDNKISGS